MEAAIEAGAEDVESDPEEGHTIYHRLRPTWAPWSRRWTPCWAQPKSTAIIWRPKSGVRSRAIAAATLMKLIDALDDDDDVQTVFANYEISDEEMARLAG